MINPKILSLLKKSKISIDDRKDIPFDQFESFLSLIETRLDDYVQRMEMANRALSVSGDEIKEYKIRLDQTRAIALQNSKMAAIGEMASNISHEINNPLSIISGNAVVISQILEDASFDESEKKMAMKNIDSIHSTTQRISKIILGLKRLSNARMEYEYKEERIFDLIEESISIGLESLKKSRIQLEMNVSPDINDLALRVPSVEFSQVLINLFTNAKQAMDELTIEKKILTINCFIRDDRFILEMINSGDPIKKDIQDKIFDSFFTTKPVGQGSGIGLNISRKIVTDMKGSLYLDKEWPSPKFVIEIPIK